MARDNKVAALANVRMFAPFSRRELALVARTSEVTTVPAGVDVVVEGDPGSDFYLILDGTAEVRRDGRRVATPGPGGSFGELALLDGGARTATVTATTDLRLLVLSSREFAAIVEDVPAVARKLLVGLAARLRDADSRAASH